MSNKNFDILQGCCDESHRKALPEWSQIVVFSSKSVQRPMLPQWQFCILWKFFYWISIIRAIGRHCPGSDTTTRISVTNEQICTGQGPLCSLSCTLYLWTNFIVMPFWANTTVYKASTANMSYWSTLWSDSSLSLSTWPLDGLQSRASWTAQDNFAIKRHLPAIVHWAEHARTVSFMIIWKVRSLYNIFC